MEDEKYLYIGIVLSILLHTLIFLAFNIKISIQKPIKNELIYIKTTHPKMPGLKESYKPKPMRLKPIQGIKPTSKSTKNTFTSYQPNYNLGVPSFKELGVSQSPTPMSKIISTLKKTNQLIIKHAKTPEKSQKEKPAKTSKQENEANVLKPKPLNTLGSDADLLDYLDNVFNYIHEQCKGEGILAINLYKNGSLKIKQTIKGNPLCPQNMQAPPMPESIMENKIQFLINFP